jgi:hypothetical protein
MAKKKAAGANGQDGAETISGYFRRVFAENPSWLNTRSNEQLFTRWLQDHPGETEVPEKVRQNLSNIKSVLRKKKRRKGGRPKKDSQPVQVTTAPSEAPRKAVRGLNALEEQIDDCLSLAKVMDREGLANVIALLRRARNEVVWSMGKTE